jgi:ABC-type glycerol-3-phosphate transport system substrate-binding protein
VMDFYTDFANPARDVYSWNKDMGSGLDAFTSGQAAFFFGYSYHYDIIKARAPQLNIEVLPMLQLNPEQPVNVANYWLQTVVGKSKHQNEAWALVNYLTHSSATKTYLDSTRRPSALRAYVLSQGQDVKLAPFAAQTLVADSWYKGRDYDTARQALNEMVDAWIKDPPKDMPVGEYKQGLLNTGASKVNQTL